MSHSIKPAASYRPFSMKQRGKLLISPTLAAQITALHRKVGGEEWSGVLAFRPVSEDLSNPENFVAIAEGIYPMDFGNPGYTEYDFSAEETFDMYEKFPKLDPAGSQRSQWRMGHIHSHHNMNAFFSGTDDQELKDNVDKYVYYLSLIVNFDGKYVAKVAFIGELEQKFSVRGKGLRTQEPEKVLVMFELDVKMFLDEWFWTRMEDVEKASRERRRRSSVPVQHHNPYYNSRDYNKSYNERIKERLFVLFLSIWSNKIHLTRFCQHTPVYVDCIS